MRGRIWLLLGLAVGVAIAVGRLPLLAPAGASLSRAALYVVGSGAAAALHAVAKQGGSSRTLEAIAAVLSVLVPGVTAWLAVIAAKGALGLRKLVALAVLVYGVASFAYHPALGSVTTLGLAVAVAAAAVMATGPVVAVVLSALAGLLAAEVIPALLPGRGEVALPAHMLSIALHGSGASPAVLAIGLLVFAAVPFLMAARSVLR